MRLPRLRRSRARDRSDVRDRRRRARYANQGPRDARRRRSSLPFTCAARRGSDSSSGRRATRCVRLNAVRQEVQAVDRDVALVEPGAFDDLIQRVFYARPRFSLLVLGIFAACGCRLVAFGVYGVLAYMVSQQTREIAIRMALGGARGHVTRMILRPACSWSESGCCSASPPAS